MDKETSSRVSSLAAKYIDFSPADFVRIMQDTNDDALANFCKNIRTLAGSALSQDETAGQTHDYKTTAVASERPIGEPVEIGGHDEDRDGPIPFQG